MQRTLRGLDVFRQFDLCNCRPLEHRQRALQPLERSHRVLAQLARGPRVAERMRALAEEADAAAANMQPRAHAVAVDWRWHDLDRRLQRHPAEPSKGILDNRGLERALTLVVDVGEHGTTARRV